jgi:hypothetical protein
MMELSKIFDFYSEAPDYITSIDMEGVEIAYENPDGEKGQHRFVYADVVKYNEQYSSDFCSSMRKFGPMIGDHRMMDTFVGEIHQLFMFLDPDGYREAYKNSYLKPAW